MRTFPHAPCQRRLTARRLPSPAVVSKGGTQIQIGGVQSWDTQMPCLMFRAADALADWAIVTYAQTQTLREFVDKLKAWAEGTGVPLGNPRICVTQGQRPADYDAAIRQHLADKKPRFVLVGVAKKEVYPPPPHAHALRLPSPRPERRYQGSVIVPLRQGCPYEPQFVFC